MPFGADVLPDGSVRFRLWAPAAKKASLCLEDETKRQISLTQLEQGWFELITREATPGARYRFLINGETKVPDPASRFQPADVHGPSEVLDPAAFEWKDDRWRGRPWEEAVIYELHIGAFTPEGTFRGVEEKLDYLRALGITAVELMPVADFPGARNWGYDGVLPYAPDSTYGRPEDLKQLVQAAHAKDLMVFLDVVYNHFGPDGNYLHLYSPQFFTNRHSTPWGDAINFDGSDSRVVRDYFIHNALYWLEEYHLDGLRLDAVHAIVDDSNPNFLTELAQTVRERFGSERHMHLILENADNQSRYLSRDPAGAVQLYNAQWNDDIHHAVHVLLTGEKDGYYAEYSSEPIRHLCHCLREGFDFQGEYSPYHGAKRGEPTDELPPSAFVSFLQNHDQVGNRALGERISRLASPEAIRVAMEILLLAPAPPLLFMGEEFGAVTPFLFFCDLEGNLAAAVTNGRRDEFARFERFNSETSRDSIPDPNDERTFLRSKLDWECLNDGAHANTLHFYRELLAVRQRVIVPHLGRTSETHCETVSGYGLSASWTFSDGLTLSLRANLGWHSIRIVDPVRGTFYASSKSAYAAAESGEFPPWSVVWSI